jgi:hypothetical protein
MEKLPEQKPLTQPPVVKREIDMSKVAVVDYSDDEDYSDYTEKSASLGGDTSLMSEPVTISTASSSQNNQQHPLLKKIQLL